MSTVAAHPVRRWSSRAYRAAALPLRAAPGAICAELARCVQSDLPLSPRLRAVFTLALLGDAPIRKVYKLAAIAGCDVCTLQREWRVSAGARAGLRLQDAVDWFVLARAADLVQSKLTWRTLGAAVGVDERTLRRTVRRLLGKDIHHPGDLVEIGLASRASAAIAGDRSSATAANRVG
jgi:hypothetical protein